MSHAERRTRPSDSETASPAQLMRFIDLPDLIQRETGLRYELRTIDKWPIPYRVIGRERIVDVQEAMAYVRARIAAGRVRRHAPIHAIDRRALDMLARRG